MATNPYPKLAEQLADAGVKAATVEKAVAAVVKAERPGRRQPDATTAKLKMAQNHTRRAYGERNEVIAVLARSLPGSHVMETSTTFATVSRRDLCLHLPSGEHVCYMISETEAETTFKFLGEPTPSHATTPGYAYATRAVRSERLAGLTFDQPAQIGEPPIAPAPAPTPEPAPDASVSGLRWTIAEWRRPKKKTKKRRITKRKKR